MEIIWGFVLLTISLRLRSWGREKGMVHPLLRPMYQNRQNFWFAFSVIGIVLFIAGIALITVALIKP
jgi:hypothetical protein